MNTEVRTRIAPSPTGLFHLGNARTALFNWLYARKMEGTFILRIEDTDTARSKEEYTLDLEQGLSWLGLGWDEGPETKDMYGPYEQSKRGEIYNKYIAELLKEDKAYKCYCTIEELDAERKEQEAQKLPPKYSGKCAKLTPEEITKLEAEGRKPSIRLRTPHEKIQFKDLVHGEMEFDGALFGDFIIVKSDGMPVFLFAGIVDDSEMKISHVIRGDDHLSNTPKQIMIARALNLALPEFGHLPMILNPDRTKLSKRKNPTSLTHDFKDQGYLPEAMVNFLALLGWKPHDGKNKDVELFTLDELVSEFDLADVGKSAAVFDVAKLDYLNGYYIRQLPLGELAKRCLPYLIQAKTIEKESEELLNALGLVQERMKKLTEAPELIDFFFKKPAYKVELLIPKKSEAMLTKKALEETEKVLSEENDFTRDSVEQLLRALAEKIEMPAGQILWPLRVALSGKPASPGAFELAEYFGKQETLARIKTAIDMLK